MSAELVGILSIGAALFVGLGGLIFTAASGINRRLDAVDRRIDGLRTEMVAASPRSPIG